MEAHDWKAAEVAAAIGEPARARMLYSLMDGRARTSTELAVIAEVSPSTASVHLKKLGDTHLVKVVAQGKHRYFALRSAEVATALEALNVLGGGSTKFQPSTPAGLRFARTCYDHVAGTLGVGIHDRLQAQGWISGDKEYQVTPAGIKALERIGIDVEEASSHRRRFAFPCVDWSERRPHIAGALGAAILDLALRRKWVQRDAEERGLLVSRLGHAEFQRHFGLKLPRGERSI